MRTGVKFWLNRIVPLFILINCAWFLLPSICHSQNTIGIPTIVNYDRQAYNAGRQNWNIIQDPDGIMYFANNKGLLSFDGTFWRTYPLPNETIVRSLALGKQNRIYIGGQEEFGYFSPSEKGELIYTSLKKLLAKKDYDFADVWNVFVLNDHVFFRSNRRLFEYDQHKIIVHNSSNWIFLGSTGTELIAYQFEKGLVSYKNGSWIPRVSYGKLPEGALPRAALAIGKDSILLPTVTTGIFLIHKDTLAPFVTADTRLATTKNIAGACMISDDRIAIGTNIGGCIIIDKKGQFIQQFTREEGVQTNNVLGVFLDRDKNLWLGLDNGIDLVVNNNSIKNIFPDNKDRNAGYTSIVHKGYLYLGTSTGVYRVKLTNEGDKDFSYTRESFEFVENSKGQVWSLGEVNGKLLMGHNRGGFIIQDNVAVPIDEKIGFWKFQPLYPNQPSSVIVGGTYNGINFLHYENGQIINSKISSRFESARFIVITKDAIWNAHPYKGLYKITFDQDNQPVATAYVDRHGFLSYNHNKLFKIKGKMILTSDKGIFEYDENLQDFKRSSFLESITGNMPVSYLKEDYKGNIWFCQGKRLAVVDLTEGTPRTIFIAEIDDKIISNGFEDINIVDSSNVFVAGEKGFFHINYAQYKGNKPHLQVLIRGVATDDTSLLFGGYGHQPDPPSINFNNNSLHFEFTSILYGQKENTEYSFYLKGFDKGWSEWTKRSEKDYTNLPAGSYDFQVKCRNNSDTESPVTSYSFAILPPWYATWWAYIIYMSAIIGMLYYFYKRQQKKYTRLQLVKLAEQQNKYAEEQRQLQYTHQLEVEKNEKEIIALRNEKLQAEVDHKNSELASYAMNLGKKMESLSKLKEDLINYKAITDPDKKHREFQKIIKVLDSELNDDHAWEQFARHFDDVHANYLRKLKEHHPQLTGTDLKLAAFLKLNLTTKEIAQLLNISIRGVETSRYRLRKKLGLANEINLPDYLTQLAN